MEERADKHFKKLQQRRAVGGLKGLAELRRRVKDAESFRDAKDKRSAMNDWKTMKDDGKTERLNVVKRRALVGWRASTSSMARAANLRRLDAQDDNAWQVRREKSAMRRAMTKWVGDSQDVQDRFAALQRNDEDLDHYISTRIRNSVEK